MAVQNGKTYTVLLEPVKYYTLAYTTKMMPCHGRLKVKLVENTVAQAIMKLRLQVIVQFGWKSH